MMKLRIRFICFLLLLTLPLLSQELGQLSNGLEYDLMHNKNPRGRASLWLAVKVGMLHEKEHQKGFAHLIEHSAWDRTEHIKDQQLEEVFDLLGIAGSSEVVISMTGVDSTVFRLSIDLAHPQAIDKALFLLKEVGTSASLLPEDIENQKKEVVQEILAEMADPMRQKLEKELEILLGRPPKIFSQELIRHTQNASALELQDFYHLHYRPDQMALIAVGDFDEKVVKSKIEGLFGSLVNPSVSSLEGKSVERKTRERTQKIWPLGLCQNPGDLTIDKGGCIGLILPPLSISDPRELSQQPQRPDLLSTLPRELPAQASFLFLEHESFSLPKISVSYLLPKDLDQGIRPMLRPLIKNRFQPLIEQGTVLSTCCSHTVVSKDDQVLEMGIVLFDETSIRNDLGKFIEELHRIEQVGFTKQEWATVQNNWRELQPLENEVYVKLYANRFLGHPLSKPSETLLEETDLEQRLLYCRDALRNCPKVVTVAVRSKEVLW